jgi:cell division protein FtsB
MFSKITNLVKNADRRHIVIVVSVGFMLYVGVATLNVISRNYDLQRQLDELAEENELLKVETQELESRIAYFRTDAFIEKEAKDKLNLRAPGEQVAIFPDKIPQEVQLEKEAENTKSFQTKAVGNFEQWLYFLFKRQPDS